MTKTISLVFSKAGILNPSQIKAINSEPNPVDVVAFGDGSSIALDQIQTFIEHSSIDPNKVNRFGIGLSPLYDLRVVDNAGEVSLPNYVYDEETRSKWFCTNIAAPHVEILLSDITSQSQTQTKLDDDLKEMICYRSYVLWRLLQVIEDKLCFPAVVLDKLIRWTNRLNAKNIDIDFLRKETGVLSLDYNPGTDLLSMTIAGEDYVVKLTLLNEIFGKIVLRQFNSLLGRRLRIAVSIIGTSGVLTDPVDMSYGELGRIIEGMQIYIKETKIDNQSPMKPQDLIEFVKRVEINDQTCIWVAGDQSLATTLEANRDRIVRGGYEDNPVS